MFNLIGNAIRVFVVGLIFLSLMGCATESHTTFKPQTVKSHTTPFYGEKTSIVVGKFQNRSGYQQGIFSDGLDQLGNQAKTILKTHLQQTNRFSVMDRLNLKEIEREAGYTGTKQAIKGARFALTGDVTEFGRKVTGDRQLFGILGSGKEQVAYAKVAINVIDVETSEIIYSTQGGGEYKLSNREIIGFGGTSGYDATLNGKVLNLAITEVVNNLVTGFEDGAWGK